MRYVALFFILMLGAPNLFAGDADGGSGVTILKDNQTGGGLGGGLASDSKSASIILSNDSAHSDDSKPAIEVKLLEVTQRDTVIFKIKDSQKKQTTFEMKIEEIESQKPKLSGALYKSMFQKANNGFVVLLVTEPAENQELEAELVDLVSPPVFGWEGSNIEL